MQNDSESRAEEKPEAELQPKPDGPSKTERVVPVPPMGVLNALGIHVGPPPDKLIEKFGTEQIDTLLQNADKDDNRKFVLQMTQTILSVAGGIIGVLALCILFLVYQKAELLEKILALLLGFLAGFGGGYGYGKSKKKDD